MSEVEYFKFVAGENHQSLSDFMAEPLNIAYAIMYSVQNLAKEKEYQHKQAVKRHGK